MLKELNESVIVPVPDAAVIVHEQLANAAYVEGPSLIVIGEDPSVSVCAPEHVPEETGELVNDGKKVGTRVTFGALLGLAVGAPVEGVGLAVGAAVTLGALLGSHVGKGVATLFWQTTAGSWQTSTPFQRTPAEDVTDIWAPALLHVTEPAPPLNVTT